MWERGNTLYTLLSTLVDYSLTDRRPERVAMMMTRVLRPPMMMVATLALHAGVYHASGLSRSKICPDGMPGEWITPCKSAELFYHPADGGAVLKPAVGNGFLSTFADADSIFAAGVFNGDYGGNNGGASHRAGVPSYLVKLVSDTGPYYAPQLVGSALDIRHAAFLRYYSTQHDNSTLIVERIFAALDRPSVLVHEFEVTTRGQVGRKLRFTGTMSNPSARDLNLTTMPAPGVILRNGTNLHPERPGDNLTSVAVLCTDSSSPIVSRISDATSIYTFLTVVVTSLNSSDPVSDAQSFYDSAHRSAAGLYHSHAAAWKLRLDEGTLVVGWDDQLVDEGNEEALFLAGSLNASLYAIRSAIRHDWPFGLSPGGLASNAYNGHTFWDQETWMWPPLLLLDSSSAASALQYRWDRRVEAHRKARHCGTKNHASSGSDTRGPLADLPADALMFPWESALTGTEVQFSQGTIGPWGKYEQHISGDVAFAARQYWYVTADIDWLKRIGYPMAKGIADFYARRVVATSSTSYSFNEVMGPDEYNWPVNNSAYTNAIAKIALHFATEAAEAVGQTADPLWSKVANGLSIPFSKSVPGHAGMTGGYHPEYKGFDPSTVKPGTFPVKQADTILLGYPLGLDLDQPDQALAFANDLTIYDPLTDPSGPAMTWSVFSIGWMNVKNYTQAAALFQRGYQNNVNSPFNVWSEVSQGKGTINFITGAGGFLQAALFGTMGIRVRGLRTLSFDPPPPSVTGIRSVLSMSATSLNFCGWQFSPTISRENMSFRVVKEKYLAKGEAFLELSLANGTVARLNKTGDVLTVPRGKATLSCSS